MSIAHTYNVEKLKKNFENMVAILKEISRTKSRVTEKLTNLKAIYTDLSKTNNKKIFLFCLDSFFFQYRTFTIEMEHIDKTSSLINNRMYCDYYKLYNIILTHIKENRADVITSEIESKTYPVYKDLDPFQEYKLNDIREIHDNILHLINQLYTQSISKKSDIDHYNEKHHIGFSISNFLNTLEYENHILKEQIALYINYVSFFHISQKKQIDRLYIRLEDFNKEIEENINVNTMFSIDDIVDEKRLTHFFVSEEDEPTKSVLTLENISEGGNSVNISVEITDQNTEGPPENIKDNVVAVLNTKEENKPTSK